MHGFWPEKLGAIAYFETMSSPFSHRSAWQLREHGIDPSFYLVHRSIDNAKSGHAASILEAIVDYVDSTAYPTTSGASASQVPSEAELVSRVFAGFLLYELSFGMLDSAAERRLAEGSTCPDIEAAWMVSFVSRFAKEASPFHKRQVPRPPPGAASPAMSPAAAGEPSGGAAPAAAEGEAVRLGALMKADPAAFVRHLSSRCDLLDASAPENSKLLSYFSEAGPMYGVATADDLWHIERWIRSVANRGMTCATE